MVSLAEEGMTMLCVTHEMGFARQVANRIILWIVEKRSKNPPPRTSFRTRKARVRRSSCSRSPTNPSGKNDPRSAGTTHIALAISISFHLAPRTSCDRAAVSAANSSARLPIPSRRRSAANQRGASAICKAGWLPRFATLATAGKSSFRFPAQRAGLSPVRCPDAVAQDNTASMRPRSRKTVSVSPAKGSVPSHKLAGSDLAAHRER